MTSVAPSPGTWTRHSRKVVIALVTVELFDDIQVFIKGTGCALWGKVQPESADGGYVLEITVEPRDDTIAEIRAAGIDLQPVRPVVGRHVTIPASLVDVVFGDDRHDEPDEPACPPDHDRSAWEAGYGIPKHD